MNIWLIAGAILALKSVISHTWRFCVSPNIIGSNKCSSSNTCIFFTVNISKAVQPLLAIHIAHGEVLYCIAAVWWRRPATTISHLHQHPGNLTVFQAPLQDASSNVPNRECMVYEQCVCVLDFLYHTGPSLLTISLACHTSTHKTKKKPLRFFQVMEVQCGIHF